MHCSSLPILFLVFFFRPPASNPQPVPPVSCSRDLQRFAPDRPSYHLVIAVFTGEDDGGYKTSRIRSKSYSERRQAVRRTWKALAVAVGIPTFFLLSDHNLTASNREEAQAFGDVLLLSDPAGEAWGYQGLSAKTLFLIQLIARQCVPVKYLFKCDDDTFVHVPRLSLFANVTHGMRAYVGKQHCGVAADAYDGVWAAPDFRNNTGLQQFPCYMQGGGYLLSGDVVKALGSVAAVIPLQRYRGLEDMAVGLWVSGWNLTTFDLFRVKLAIDVIGNFNDSRVTSWLCKNRWLFIHRVFCGSLPRRYDHHCGPKGYKWAAFQRSTSALLPYIPPALWHRDNSTGLPVG
eukprot:EG_transcript_13514